AKTSSFSFFLLLPQIQRSSSGRTVVSICWHFHLNNSIIKEEVYFLFIYVHFRRGFCLITILLCDDHAVVRMGLKMLLNHQPEMQVVAEASEWNDASKKSLEAKPDVIHIDLSMPNGKDGLSATSELKKMLPESAILILTMHDDAEYLFRAIQAGASGSVLKSAPHEELLTAIRTVSTGEAYLSPVATKKLMEEYL